MLPPLPFFSFFFFNATPPTEIYTLSLHDALPIWPSSPYTVITCFDPRRCSTRTWMPTRSGWKTPITDRKSTRLNSSHQIISYAVFCLKKKIDIMALRVFILGCAPYHHLVKLKAAF